MPPKWRKAINNLLPARHNESVVVDPNTPQPGLERARERWYQMLYSLHLIFPFVWGNVIRIGDHHPVALCSTVVLLIKTATMEQLPPDSLCPRQALSKDWIFHGAPRQHYCRTALTSLPKALVARLVWKKKRGRKHQLFDTFDISLSARDARSEICCKTTIFLADFLTL